MFFHLSSVAVEICKIETFNIAWRREIRDCFSVESTIFLYHRSHSLKVFTIFFYLLLIINAIYFSFNPRIYSNLHSRLNSFQITCIYDLL